MWLSGIIAIKNSNRDNASPWNIPLWIFTSAFVSSTQQFFMVSLINFWTLSNILYILKQFITIIIIIIIIVTLWEFFTSANADGLSLESEWQQVSSSL